MSFTSVRLRNEITARRVDTSRCAPPWRASRPSSRAFLGPDVDACAYATPLHREEVPKVHQVRRARDNVGPPHNRGDVHPHASGGTQQPHVWLLYSRTLGFGGIGFADDYLQKVPAEPRVTRLRSPPPDLIGSESWNDLISRRGRSDPYSKGLGLPFFRTSAPLGALSIVFPSRCSPSSQP